MSLITNIVKLPSILNIFTVRQLIDGTGLEDNELRTLRLREFPPPTKLAELACHKTTRTDKDSFKFTINEFFGRIIRIENQFDIFIRQFNKNKKKTVLVLRKFQSIQKVINGYCCGKWKWLAKFKFQPRLLRSLRINKIGKWVNPFLLS